MAYTPCSLSLSSALNAQKPESNATIIMQMDVVSLERTSIHDKYILST